MYMRDLWFGFRDDGWPKDSWGLGEEFSERIPLSFDEAIGPDRRIVAVSGGWNHAFCITEGPEGTEVFAWGFNL